MWPFDPKRARSLVGLSKAASVDLVATVVSPDDVRSPLSELCAALVWIQVTECLRLSGSRREIMDLAASGADLSHFDKDRVLGSVILGDALLLRTDDAIDITLCPRSARVVFATNDNDRYDDLNRLSSCPPELDRVLERASGGQIRYRENGLSCGARVRLRAVVEPSSFVGPSPYRCAAKTSFAVREHAGRVDIEQMRANR